MLYSFLLLTGVFQQRLGAAGAANIETFSSPGPPAKPGSASRRLLGLNSSLKGRSQTLPPTLKRNQTHWFTKDISFPDFPIQHTPLFLLKSVCKGCCFKHTAELQISSIRVWYFGWVDCVRSTDFCHCRRQLKCTHWPLPLHSQGATRSPESTKQYRQACRMPMRLKEKVPTIKFDLIILWGGLVAFGFITCCHFA